MNLKCFNPFKTHKLPCYTTLKPVDDDIRKTLIKQFPKLDIKKPIQLCVNCRIKAKKKEPMQTKENSKEVSEITETTDDESSDDMIEVAPPNTTDSDVKGKSSRALISTNKSTTVILTSDDDVDDANEPSTSKTDSPRSSPRKINETSQEIITSSIDTDVIENVEVQTEPDSIEGILAAAEEGTMSLTIETVDSLPGGKTVTKELSVPILKLQIPELNNTKNVNGDMEGKNADSRKPKNKKSKVLKVLSDSEEEQPEEDITVVTNKGRQSKVINKIQKATTLVKLTPAKATGKNSRKSSSYESSDSDHSDSDLIDPDFVYTAKKSSIKPRKGKGENKSKQKGRGRPKKQKSSSNESEEESEPPKSNQKGRGRPKKQKLPSNESEEESEPPKSNQKGRGRPKKQKSPSNESKEEDDPPKSNPRPRGRPKKQKSPSNESEEEIDPPKNPRGRPIKQKFSSESDEEKESDSEIKSKRKGKNNTPSTGLRSHRKRSPSLSSSSETEEELIPLSQRISKLRSKRVSEKLDKDDLPASSSKRSYNNILESDVEFRPVIRKLPSSAVPAKKPNTNQDIPTPIIKKQIPRTSQKHIDDSANDPDDDYQELQKLYMSKKIELLDHELYLKKLEALQKERELKIRPSVFTTDLNKM